MESTNDRPETIFEVLGRGIRQLPTPRGAREMADKMKALLELLRISAPNTN
jgi:hypothetical protein